VNNYLVWHVTAGSYHFRLGPPNTPPPTLTNVVIATVRKGSLGFSFAFSHVKQHVDIAEVQSVKIYNLAGKTVRALEVPPHSREASWNGRDAAGAPVYAGIYLVRFMGNGECKTIKVRIR
jgi:flagellar hook assembly protein FlgD